MKWKIHQEGDKEDDTLTSYTLTLGDYSGWNTDGGHGNYGLPKELAQWICDTLNKHGKDCPYRQDDFGSWEKK